MVLTHRATCQSDANAPDDDDDDGDDDDVVC
jgi:hypothetical protein